MNKLFSAFTCYILALLCFLPSPAAVADDRPGILYGEVEFPLTTFDGRDVTLLINLVNGRTVMRMPINFYDTLGQRELQFMAEEALRLTSGKEVKLGKTGFTFRFTGGYPIWGPHQTLSNREGHHECLFFAVETKIYGAKITARGENSKPLYSWYED